jgi:hypothetical protein
MTVIERRSVRRNRIVPFSVKRITIDVDRTHLRVGNPDGFGIAVLIEVALHIQPACGRRGPNELDDDFAADKRLATPVLCDECEQPVLYAVPFTGPRRVVSNRNGQAGFVGEALEFMLPSCFHSRTRAPLLPPQSAVMSRPVEPR